MSWKHLRDSIGRAKVNKVCCLCGRLIIADSLRVKRFGVDGREFVRVDMHHECEAVTHDWDAMDWETFSPGDGEWPEPEATMKGGE